MYVCGGRQDGEGGRTLLKMAERREMSLRVLVGEGFKYRTSSDQGQAQETPHRGLFSAREVGGREASRELVVPGRRQKKVWQQGWGGGLLK